MVAVFCFCWGPYATFAMINISGHGKVDLSFNDDVGDLRASASVSRAGSSALSSWSSSGRSPDIDHLTSPTLQDCDCLEPGHLCHHEPHGKFLHSLEGEGERPRFFSKFAKISYGIFVNAGNGRKFVSANFCIKCWFRWIPYLVLLGFKNLLSLFLITNIFKILIWGVNKLL